jgi:hypothetical protein
LNAGQPRQEIELFFRQTANEENKKNAKVIDFGDLLDKNGKKRFLIVVKESLGDLLYLTSLLKSFSKSYPPEEWDLYIGCDPKYFELFDGNPYVKKCLPYHPAMESEISMTGQVTNPGYFQGFCHVAISTQRILNYLKNDNIALELN